MELLIHHLIGRYVINLPAIACLVAGIFATGAIALSLPTNLPTSDLLVMIVCAGSAFAAIAEIFRIKARLFTAIPLSWIGGVAVPWLCYMLWSYKGIVIGVIVLACFWGIILGASFSVEVWDRDRADHMLRRLNHYIIRGDQMQIWIDASKAWFSPRFRHRARAAAHHNTQVVKWILSKMGQYLSNQETVFFAEILDQLTPEATEKRLKSANRRCGDLFISGVDAHLQRAFGKRLQVSLRMTRPSQYL